MRNLAAPQVLLLMTTLVMAVLVLAAVLALIRQPWLGLTLAAGPYTTGLSVVAVDPQGPSAGKIRPGDVLTGIAAGNAAPILLNNRDVIDDPDQTGSYAEYNDILQRQGALSRLLRQPQVRLILGDGSQVMLHPRPARPLTSLPLIFWYQCLCALCGLLLATGLWVFQTRNIAVSLYALSGVGLVLAIMPAALSSSRELALGESLIRLNSVTNNLGRLVFLSSLVVLFWYYPKRLSRHPVGPVVALGALLCWVLDTGQYFQSINVGARLPILVLFCIGACLAYLQLAQARRRPADRAIIHWFILCALIGPGSYFALYFARLAFGWQPFISQQAAWGALTFFYVLMAFGVVRYKLFQLEQWWVTGWMWFLAGLAVIVVDLALVSVLHLDEKTALALSLAFAGFVYFPLRQKIWELLPWHERRVNLLDALPKVFGTRSGQDYEIDSASWQAALARIFSPLEIRVLETQEPDIVLSDSGLTLRVPGLKDQPSLELYCARHGGRLFNQKDVELAKGLRLLFQRMMDHQKAFADGVQTERARIARDLHDDLGAKLLTMVYRSSVPELQEAARDAVSRLRVIMNALESGERCLDEVIPDWRAEAQERCASAQIELCWESADCPQNPLLDARFQVNMKRLVQEAISNTIRHAQARRIDVRISASDNQLRVVLADDGCGLKNTRVAGGGMRSMQKRVRELGGEITWSKNSPRGCCVSWSVPIMDRS